MKIAIIGFGYWGPNLVRNFSQLAESQVAWIADLRPERLVLAKKLYSQIPVTSSIEDTLKDPQVDAVVIATPVRTHFSLAKRALEAGKHVLLEKPMTSSVEEAVQLIELAKVHRRVLMVDHTFLYTGAVEKIKQMIDRKEIGDIHYFDSTRVNLGLFQADVNVLWDLAAHDLSILGYLFDEKPKTVNAIGRAHLTHQKESIAYLTLGYSSGAIAHFHCSWVSPVKIRQILIGGNKKMILYNDLEPTEKVKVYDTGYKECTDETKNLILVDYRIGDVYLPKVSVKEALSGLAEDFRSAVMCGTEPRADGHSGLEVVRILDAAEQSMRQNGREVSL